MPRQKRTELWGWLNLEHASPSSDLSYNSWFDTSSWCKLRSAGIRNCLPEHYKFWHCCIAAVCDIRDSTIPMDDRRFFVWSTTNCHISTYYWLNDESRKHWPLTLTIRHWEISIHSRYVLFSPCIHFVSSCINRLSSLPKDCCFSLL